MLQGLLNFAPQAPLLQSDLNLSNQQILNTFGQTLTKMRSLLVVHAKVMTDFANSIAGPFSSVNICF